VKLVYVAGPYRANDNWLIAQNIRRAEALSLEVWKMGCACICPHANTANFQGAAPDSVWLEGDLEMLRRCDAILMTPDWTTSSGAKAERRFALDLPIPVLYTLLDLHDWLKFGSPRTFYSTQQSC
jgi:hypothetical protein